MKPTLGVLLGDSAGVGPELIVKLCTANKLYKYCNPVLIGDIRIFNRAQQLTGENVEVNIINTPEEANFDNEKVYNFIDFNDVDPDKVPLGEVNEISGKAAGDAIFYTMDLCKRGIFQGFVFGPLNKVSLKLGGHNYESENKLFGEYFENGGIASEINVLDDLLTTRVTSHVPIKDVSSYLTEDSILRAIKLIQESLNNKGIENPRIGIAALNPHCGEDGTCGREEIDVIIPSIEKAQSLGINAIGPNSSDILFIRAFKGDYDGVVTMYHDQGQIALKLKGFQYGVTLHGALPVAIATAAHGTAFDIVGKNIATTDAMENAVKLASEVAKGIMK